MVDSWSMAETGRRGDQTAEDVSPQANKRQDKSLADIIQTQCLRKQTALSGTRSPLATGKVDAGWVVTKMKPAAMSPHAPQKSGSKIRRSACASASLRVEIERLSAMSIEQRIRTALGMKQRFASLRPAPLGR
jgi:hypothetical protein